MAAKMWRPPNWEGTIKEIKVGLIQYPFCDSERQYLEAGADAMLEALKHSQSIEYIDGQQLKLFGSADWVDWHLKGLIVFIPDK